MRNPSENIERRRQVALTLEELVASVSGTRLTERCEVYASDWIDAILCGDLARMEADLRREAVKLYAAGGH